jgi:hypothetical protein
MRCRQFEDEVMDLVREIDQEGPVRNQALEHAGGCPRCSALLANQQALSTVIKLAATDSSQAPERIETALISAFRRRQAGKIRNITPLPMERTWPARYMGIAAALLIALLGITAFRMLRTLRPEEAPVSGSVSQEPLPKTSRPAAKDATPGQTAPDRSPAPLASSAKPATRAAVPKRPAERAAPETIEIATDFFALTSGVELNSMESGQLVRVQLPRNAMAPYGLPVNQDRLDKPVTAQVLIGQDGVARAIRFLSEQNASFVQTEMRSKR